MHEHHLIDIGAGAVLGLAAVATVQRWASGERTLEALRIQGLRLKDMARTIRRHPRELPAATAAFFRGFPHSWRETRYNDRYEP
jgi:hypothetical protein